MHSNKNIHSANILLVDDNPVNLQVLGGILKKDGYQHITAISEPSQVLPLYKKHQYDLMVLDIHMPNMTGFDVMDQLNSHFPDDFLPIIVLTADDFGDTRDQALASGARDFMRKPFNNREVLLRARNLIETVFLHKELRYQNERLDQRVRQRTEQLYYSQVKLIECLGRAAEFKDNETGMHVIRISKTTGIIAQALGLPRREVELIEQASPMHDIGKIGIPDRILLKPGKLEGDDWSTMQNHAILGASILADNDHDSELLRMAAEIALTHHERWDGSGYPHGLKGEEIPLEARIVSLADIYDALSSSRSYKEAFNESECQQVIRDEAGKSLDPQLVELFFDNIAEVLEIKQTWVD